LAAKQGGKFLESKRNVNEIKVGEGGEKTVGGAVRLLRRANFRLKSTRGAM